MMRERISMRTMMDYYLYILRLDPKEKIKALVGCGAFGLGLFFWIFELCEVWNMKAAWGLFKWVSLMVSFISMQIEIIKIAEGYKKRKYLGAAAMKDAGETIEEKFAGVSVCDGFTIEKCVIGKSQFLYMYAEAVDAYLMAEPVIRIEKNLRYIKRIRRFILEDKKQLLAMLFYQYKNSDHGWRKIFVNEKKFCLSSDFALEIIENRSELNNGKPIEVSAYRAGYYDYLLSNGFLGKKLEANDEKDKCLIQIKPAYPICKKNGAWQMLPIGSGRCVQMVGVSTLAMTKDGFIVLLTQSEKAMGSPGRIAPSGSGSADWKDYTLSENKDLLSVVKVAMQRELYEELRIKEAGYREISGIANTRVLGYFRWIAKCGSPEFYGITSLDLDFADLDFERKEINKIEGTYAARIYDLIQAAEKWMQSEKLSVPLYVILSAIRKQVYTICRGCLFYDHQKDSVGFQCETVCPMLTKNNIFP